MDKLIELVYYYNSHLDKGQIGIGLTTSVKEDGREVSFDKEKEIRKYENYIISKKYGFIERLVKNEKIDFKTFGNAFGTKYLEYPIGSNNYDQVHDYEDIIKWLAISDTPMEDLIYYLK